MRQHIVAFLVALGVLWAVHLAGAGIGALTAHADPPTGAVIGYCNVYPVHKWTDVLCQPSGERCAGVCRRYIALEGGCRSDANSSHWCANVYLNNVHLLVEEADCVGSPPCNTTSSCGSVWNSRGTSSYTATIRWCAIGSVLPPPEVCTHPDRGAR